MANQTKPGNGRIQFTLIDMIRALQGFRSPEGYAVIPNDIVEQIKDEIERLYGVEEAAIELYQFVGAAEYPAIPPLHHPAMRTLAMAAGLSKTGAT